LVPLPKRQQRAAWKTAVNEVKGVPTATVVQRVVDDIKCGDGRFVRPTESSDPSAIPYSIASPAAQACWPRLKGNEEKGSTKAGDKVSDKGGNNCSQSKDSTKALGQPSRLDLIIAKVRDAILMVQHLMPLFDNTDTSARAEAQLAISRLESLEAKFVRKQRKAA
jgi:hypothetical protein